MIVLGMLLLTQPAHAFFCLKNFGSGNKGFKRPAPYPVRYQPSPARQLPPIMVRQPAMPRSPVHPPRAALQRWRPIN